MLSLRTLLIVHVEATTQWCIAGEDLSLDFIGNERILFAGVFPVEKI